jgi:hypothetical protein
LAISNKRIDVLVIFAVQDFGDRVANFPFLHAVAAEVRLLDVADRWSIRDASRARFSGVSSAQ